MRANSFLIISNFFCALNCLLAIAFAFVNDVWHHKIIKQIKKALQELDITDEEISSTNY
jgi:hypothetical protein